MPKLALTFGLILIICLITLKVGAYYDGLAFSKSWTYPMIVLPMGLVAALSCAVFSLITLGLILQRKAKASNLLYVIATPFLMLVIYQFSFPSFADGLHDAVQSKLKREMLLDFASYIRQIDQDINHITPQQDLYKSLKQKYLEAMNLSPSSSRIRNSEKAVTVYYGSALTKHWGVSIASDDTCPKDYLPNELCIKVYDNVWVFDDFW